LHRGTIAKEAQAASGGSAAVVSKRSGGSTGQRQCSGRAAAGQRQCSGGAAAAAVAQRSGKSAGFSSAVVVAQPAQWQQYTRVGRQWGKRRLCGGSAASALAAAQGWQRSAAAEAQAFAAQLR